MHIRPYVDLPDAHEELPPERETRAAPDLAPFARCGTDETAELPALTAGHGADGADGPGEPAGATRLLDVRLTGLGHGYGHGHGGAYGVDDGHRGAVRDRGGESGRHGVHDGEFGRDGGLGEGADFGDGGDFGYDGESGHDGRESYDLGTVGDGGPVEARRGSHRRGARTDGARRRRRPSAAVLTAAGVVGALGAGVLVQQAYTADNGGDGHSYSADDRALSDIPTGPPVNGSADSHARHHRSTASASPTPTRSAPARADRDSDTHTAAGTASAQAPSSSGTGETAGRTGRGDGASGSASAPGGGWHRGGEDRSSQDQQQPTGGSEQTAEPTLKAGDSGSEVAELQRRLKQAGVLPQNAPEDGVYSSQVQNAVAQYQANQSVQGDVRGEYGPNTRQALESQTAG